MFADFRKNALNRLTFVNKLKGFMIIIDKSSRHHETECRLQLLIQTI